MVAAVTHPRIPPVKREEVSMNKRAYAQRFYHVPSITYSRALDYRDTITLHLDRRISLFFIHLITCWKTPFEFKIEGANEQFGKGKNSPVKTRAAHSSTLPGLLFRERGTNNPWSVYLKGSHTSNLHNATVDFLACLNDADSLIDGQQEHKDKLRCEAIKLINDVAQNQRNPVAAMHCFMKKFLKVSNSQLKALSETVPKRNILQIYIEHANAVQQEMKNDPSYFDSMLNLRLAGNKQEERLRLSVYQTRFKLIRDTQMIETQIAAAILDVNQTITKSKTRTIGKIDTDLRYHLLDKAKGWHKTCLERFLCTSTEQLTYNLRNSATAPKKRSQFYTKNKEQIDELLHKIRLELHRMDRLELLSRSEAIRSIRHARDWRQLDVANEYKKLFPREAMSPSTYCRLERHALADTKSAYKTPESQRKQITSLLRAKHLSETFRVDPGLILPSLISSNY